MDTLIAIGSAASLVYGIFAIYRIGYGLGVQDIALVDQYRHDLYFESAVMILAFINVGKYLEARSKGKTSEAIRKLMDMAPKTAVVERDGRQIEIPAEEAVEGDIFVVKPGAVFLQTVLSSREAPVWMRPPSQGRAFLWRRQWEIP